MTAASAATTVYDVAVIGAGVVGAAVARLLSLHDLDVILIDAADDVGAGTSKANTAILHTGFDAIPGSIESGMVSRGYELLHGYAPTVGISLEATGALLVAWDDEQAASLPRLHDKAVANGYHRAEIIDADEVREREPHLGPGVTGGMLVPDEHLIDPWSTPIAFATEAVANGCGLMLRARVVSVEIGSEVTVLGLHHRTVVAGPTHATTSGEVRARFIVNAAGLYGDVLHRAAGFDGFTIRPRRGELIVFDKLARPLVRRTILPVPTPHTKGVLVAPTVFGNVMLGPTADDIDDREATGSTRAGLDFLIEQGRRIIPGLVDEEVTAVYAGLRAATEHSDYQLSHDAGARYVGLGGIRSTGLTASMALAENTLARLRSIGLVAHLKASTTAVVVASLGEAGERPYQSGGRIVCHCERVTAQEITDALTGVIPATSNDGLRRRTRALAGRCQGFYCIAEIAALSGWPVDR